MSDTINPSNAGTIAVVKTRLPYIDRRALSQAWFSALGLHERSAAAAASEASARTPNTSALVARRPAGSREAQGPRASGERAGRPHSAQQRSKSADTAAAAPSSRSQKGAVRRPTIATLRYPPVHAAFRLELDGGRVHVVVRREGAVLHVVALCSERHVERVRRALALAAEHLRLRGEALCADVRALQQAGAA